MKRTQRVLWAILIAGILPLAQAGCGDDSTGTNDNVTVPDAGPTGFCPGDDPSLDRPENWTVESHCDGAGHDYDLLFDDTVVHRIDITVTPALYQATMDNLDDILFGGGPGDSDVEDPMWVPVTVEFNGLTWTEVGMRYKGNSSLRSAWQQGVHKLSFRFNFDKYEDDHPELDDQRFYGFKKMTFSNGFKDPSLLRDKTAADIFRSAGVPAARGAFTRVYVDFGQGSTYFGLYTMIEDPSDEMLDRQFDDGDGNLYKPDGDGARWTNFIEDHFEKKTNEEDSDWSDIIAGIDALQASRTDAAVWRAGLEVVFDVDLFLRVLAINQTMTNWDSYGCMTHNYYVYSDPSDDGRLKWFPWDLNESMLSGGMPGCFASSVMLDELGSEWPLVRYLLDDPVYRQLYQDELELALEGAFEPTAVKAMMQSYHNLIAPYVVGADGESAPYTFLGSDAEFTTSLTSGPSGLEPHVDARVSAVQQALGL